MMQEQEKKTIKNHLPYLTKNVGSIKTILDILYSEAIFKERDIERVNAVVATEDKVRNIVNILLYKDSNAIPGFKKALRETNQHYIVEELEKIVPLQSSQIDDDLKLFISNALKNKFEAADTGSKVSLQDVWEELRNTARYHGRTCEFDDVDDSDIVHIIKTVFTSCKIEHQSPKGKHKRTNIHCIGIWTKDEQYDTIGKTPCNDQDIGATGANDTSVERKTCDDNQTKCLYDMDVNELCIWLADVKERTNSNFDIKKFSENEIDGVTFLSLTDAELKELIPPLGPRKKLIMEREKATVILKPETKPLPGITKTPTDFKLVEVFRKFDHDVGVTDKYRKGSVINIEHTRVKNLIDPIHRFILPKYEEKDEILDCVMLETVKFGAACMNERTNGTIHFGIVGSSDDKDGYKAGEIVGIQVDRVDCQKRLTDAIQQYFFPDQLSKALSCIRPAKFIEVTAGVSMAYTLYIIEVDVVPTFKIVNGETFFLQPLDGNEKGSCSFYRYSENGPALQDHRNIAEYMKECHTISENRKDAEDRLLKGKYPVNLFKKLSDFLCCGYDRLESDIYPLLFINSPDTHMETNLEQFAFLKNIPCRAVFDFSQDRENSIMYRYLNEDLNQVFQTKLVEDFDIDRVDKKQMKETLDGLKESSVPAWVFCSSPDMEDGNNDVTSWKLKYSKSFREILKFYNESIPKERARVLFLLLSQHFEIMQEAAIEVMIEFQDQSIFIAENELCASQWKDCLLKAHCIDKRNLEDCCLIGLPWSQVNDSIQKMSDPGHKKDAEISRSTGAPCYLSERMKKELSDLEILGMNDCELRDESLTETERENLQREVGEKFYTGEQATWFNFYYPHQVLIREKSDELRGMISTSLISEIEDPEDCVRSVAIYHQPGAGGTTLGKSMLWEFRKNYRCCIIQNITSQTGDQLFRLFEYQEDNKPKPLLVFIDNGDDDHILPLYEDLQKRKRSETDIFCVLLVCYRKTEMPSKKINRNILLTQKLSDPEVKWLKVKHQDLQAKFKQNKGCNPKQLLSFNIMKENYNKECIENSVIEFVRDMYARKEGMLLKLIAFANTFDSDFKAIPAACFDQVMSTQHRNGWECRLSQAARVLLNRNNNRGVGGKIASFRVSSSLLSRYILNAVLDVEKEISGTKKTIGEVALEFLHSPLFKDTRRHSHHQLDILLRITLNIVNKRVWNDTKRSQFSPLIVELISQGDTYSALNVLTTTYEITENPIVAQQIARYYESIKEWDLADQYIDDAIHQSEKTKINSYLWHTKGQICHSRLSALKEQPKQQKKLNISETIRLSREAIFLFRKVQELSRNEDSLTQNLAGYDGEIQITLELLNILCNSSYFSGQEQLRRFLLERNDDQSSSLDKGDVEFLRGLQSSVYEALENLERSIHLVEEKQFLDQNKRLAILNGRQLERYKANLLSWFVTPLPTGGLSKNEKFLYNRSLARGMGATSFTSILNMREDSQTLKKMYSTIIQNLHDGSTCPDDYWIIIAIILALPDCDREKGMLAKAVELSRKHFDSREKLKNPWQVAESCLYMALLHWPSRDICLPNLCPQSVLKNVITVWNDVSSSLAADKKRRDKILFYLCNGKEDKRFIHDGCLRDFPKTRGCKNNIYRTNLALNHLVRLEGLLRNNGEVIEVKLCKPGDNVGPTIQIPVLCPIKRYTDWNRQFYFVLGFGLKGLKAIDLSDKLPLSNYGGNTTDPERVRLSGLLTSSYQYPSIEDGRRNSPTFNIAGDARLRYNQNQRDFQPHIPPSANFYSPENIVQSRRPGPIARPPLQSPGFPTQGPRHPFYLQPGAQHTFNERNTRYQMPRVQRQYQFEDVYK